MSAGDKGRRLEEVIMVYQIEHDNGTDGQTWVRAHLDFDEIEAEYATAEAAETVAAQARIDHEGIRFAVRER